VQDHKPGAPAWDAALYDRSFGVIPQFGTPVVDLLAPSPGLKVLDLGCGTGQLTAAIAAAGADVTGMDGDAAMVAQARQNYPNIPFLVGRGQDFTLAEPVDAVFSNAALHWMSPPEAVAQHVFAALNPGGRLVAEMGGQGNVAILVDALEQALGEEGVEEPRRFSPWYFPSIPEYSALLERTGFEVQYMYLFDRPTPF
jgi:trans-aconitate methyltransferase